MKPARNIRSVSVRHKGLNQKVERLNGIFRKSVLVNPNSKYISGFIPSTSQEECNGNDCTYYYNSVEII